MPMQKITAVWLPILLLTIFPVGMIAFAYAQTGALEDETTTKGDLSVHIPKKMISGVSYEGMLLLADPVEYPVTVSLASSSSYVEMPHTVTISSGANHAIFPVVPAVNNNEITVHAVSSAGSIAVDTAAVYSVAERPTSLLIVGPAVMSSLPADANFFRGDSETSSQATGGNVFATDPVNNIIKTSVRSVPFKVILADDYGMPIAALHDIYVIVTSSSSAVQFSDVVIEYGDSAELLLRKGQYSAEMTATINGDGRIYAFSPGLRSGFIDVDYDSDDLVVRLGVAPNPAAVHSEIYYYVWIERDGSVFVPDDILDVYMSSSNMQSVWFDQKRSTDSINRVDDGSFLLHLTDGISRGTASVGLADRQVSVTASISGVGSATQTIDVQDTLPAHLQNSFDANTKPNMIKAWVYPDTPAEQAWAVVGMYHDDSLKNSSYDKNGQANASEDRSVALYPNLHRTVGMPGVMPVRILDETVTISDDGGLVYPSKIKVSGPLDRSSDLLRSSVEIPLKISDFSDHVLTADIPDAKSVDISFESRPRYGTGNKVVLTPIPISMGVQGDIAFVSVTDYNDRLVDVGSAVDINASGVVQFGDAIQNLQLSPFWTKDGITRISGMHVKDGARLHAYIPGISSEPTELSTAGVARGIEMWFPPRVNTGAQFPITVHAIDQNGVPVALLTDMSELSIFSDSLMIMPYNNLLRALAVRDGIGTASVISAERHVNQAVFESFSNRMDGRIYVESQTPSVLRLGADIVLDMFTGLLSRPDIEIATAGNSIIFERDGETGRYVATPVVQGEYHVTVNVRQPGWSAFSEDLVFSVERLTDITFNTVADDGVSLPLELNLHDQSGGVQTIHNGVFKTIRPGVFELEIPASHTMGSDRTYVLRELYVNNEEMPVAPRFTHNFDDDNMDVSAVYHREITVRFEPFVDSDAVIADNALISGTGMYRYGDTVILQAPYISEFFGLVWHIPSSWTGLPDDAVINADTAVFEALDSVDGHISYEKNYTAMIALVASCVIILFVLARRRSPDLFLNLKERMMTSFADSLKKRMTGRKKGM